ncbi:MAG: DUF4402 domain-containing protein [bacterium]
MKKVLKNLAVISAIMLFVLVFSSPKFAQSATLDDLTTSAQVMDQIGINYSVALMFGTFVPGDSPGTINPTHTTITGPIESFSPGMDPVILVTGQPSAGVNVTIDPTCTISNGTDSMVADLSVPPTLNLDGSGESPLIVTATLNVNANQPPGLYMGTCSITVNY